MADWFDQSNGYFYDFVYFTEADQDTVINLYLILYFSRKNRDW